MFTNTEDPLKNMAEPIGGTKNANEK